MNLFSAAQLSSSAFAASSHELIHRRLCPISANNLISLPRIAFASTESHARKTDNGSNGHLPIGNFSLTIFGHDFSRLTDVSFWNSTGDRTGLRSLLQNCAHFLNGKARGSFVGKRCLQRTRISGRASSYCSRRPLGRRGCVCHLRATFRRAKRLQFPI